MTRSEHVRQRAPPQRAALEQAEKIWVATTLTLILFLVGTSQACILVPYFLYNLPTQNGETFRKLVQLLVPFNVGAIGILWNYALCVGMDPGAVPPSFTPPLLEQQRVDSSEGELRNGKHGTTPRAITPRHCKSCKSYKPPRAHHCRTCKRCVLRMDHHCPWIANCVGQRNYASFVRFLACVDVTCAMHLGLLTARTCDYWWLQVGGVWRAPSTLQMTFLVLNFALCIPTFLLVGVFSLYHFWNLCTNTTTIEGWEKDKVERMINRGRIRDTDYPFDLGTLRNVTSILGRSPMLWCLPSVTTGDGLSFDVSEGIDPIEQYDWPPRDPSKAERSRQYIDVSGSPFTYGDNFNPALRPTNNSTLRQRAKSRVPPWHADYSHDGRGGDVEDEMDTAAEAGLDTGDKCLPHDTDDQRPDLPDELGTSSSSSDVGDDEQYTGTRTRFRRGSEGYEVQPKRFDVAYAEQYEREQEHVLWDASGSDAESAIVDASDDDAAWVWRQQQRQEERIRRQIQEDWRRQLRESRQNGQLDGLDAVASPQARTGTIEGTTGILLPSQIQQQRATAALNGTPNAQGNGGADVERADGASKRDD